MVTVEFVKFKKKENVNEEDFLEASENIMQDVRKLKGFIERKLVKSEEHWADIVYWQTNEDAINASKEIMNHQSCLDFFSMIEESSIDMNHFEVQKEYK